MAGTRVAVYIDFDNMVISRYDDVHGDSAWRKDDARSHRIDAGSTDPVDVRLAEAEVDLGAIIDYASSYGTVALTRAYADWSGPANAAYKRQLIDRAVDLVQLFTASGTKNGADIRLSIDAVEDLFRHDDLTHVVIVGGDSDYVALAQRCRRMGRVVVGIGVTGSISRALVAACDEFSRYSDLPGVNAGRGGRRGEPADPDRPRVEPEGPRDQGERRKAPPARPARDRSVATVSAPSPLDQARALFVRALQVGSEKSDDGWLQMGGVKSQMQRLDSTFKEKALGYSTFSGFVEDQADLVETRAAGNGQQAVRLR